MKVIQFGVGGVGSWCAEALVRGGVEDLTIVDFDVVSESNINRQLMATTKTVGLVKVDVLKERLAEINPGANITALRMRYTAETAESFCFDDYDFVIDAIDSLNDKAHLIYNVCASRAQLVSSMGAAGKRDPLQVRVTEFWKVKTCPLARALRQRFRKSGIIPAKKFLAVYSEEQGQEKMKPHIQVTATFGLNIAAIVLNSEVGELGEL